MKLQLKFMTDDARLRKICQDYWQQDDEGDFVFTVKEIANRYEQSYYGFAQFVAQYCQAFSVEDACSKCGEHFWVFKSRSEYTRRKSSHRNWTCNSCKRKKQEALERRRERRRNELLRFYGSVGRGKVTFEDTEETRATSLKDAITLLGVVRLAATEDFSHIRSPNVFGEGRLSPTRDYDVELLRSLVDSGVLVPDASYSPLSAFVYEEDDSFSGQYYFFRAAYSFPELHYYSESRPHIDDPEELISTLEGIFLDMSWPDSWYNQCIPLWKEVALNECLQYLDLCMKKHSFEFSPGEKTRRVLQNALSTFSTAQVFNFIWGSAQSAAAYYMRERIPKRRAANSVVGTIQRRADRARAEGWDVKAYRRDWDCPQTMFSRILFDVVLQIGDEGFNEPLA